jgi:hypothetical protein
MPLLLLVAALALMAARRSSAPGAALSAGDPPAHARWMGVATCAAMGCHHGNGPLGNPKGSEYSIWSAHDKHARAFQVLYEDRSQGMVKLLYPGKKLAATETELCLKCHATGEGVLPSKDPAAFGDRFYLGDGVSCESCHGAAENWLPKHYQSDFRSLSAEEKEKAGLRNLRHVARRAEACVQCHVGTPDKEVNHDLIAAGHPRLNFEFAGFHALYPKHWSRDVDPADFEARAWEVGQVVSARAALQLLQARASDLKKPWPEFAEYNCFACHKDLWADSPRQKAGYAGRRPGSLPWGSWYVSELGALASKAGGKGKEVEDAIRDLRNAMQTGSPDARRVKQQVPKLVDLLNRWLGQVEKQRLDPAAVRSLLRGVAGDAADRAAGMSWDEAAQAYLALAALGRGLAELSGETLSQQSQQALITVRLRLQGAFEPGFSSPRRFDPRVPSFLRDDFRAIGDRLGRE